LCFCLPFIELNDGYFFMGSNNLSNKLNYLNRFNNLDDVFFNNLMGSVNVRSNILMDKLTNMMLSWYIDLTNMVKSNAKLYFKEYRQNNSGLFSYMYLKQPHNWLVEIWYIWVCLDPMLDVNWIWNSFHYNGMSSISARLSSEFKSKFGILHSMYSMTDVVNDIRKYVYNITFNNNVYLKSNNRNLVEWWINYQELKLNVFFDMKDDLKFKCKYNNFFNSLSELKKLLYLHLFKDYNDNFYYSPFCYYFLKDYNLYSKLLLNYNNKGSNMFFSILSERSDSLDVLYEYFRVIPYYSDFSNEYIYLYSYNYSSVLYDNYNYGRLLGHMYWFFYHSLNNMVFIKWVFINMNYYVKIY